MRNRTSFAEDGKNKSKSLSVILPAFVLICGLYAGALIFKKLFECNLSEHYILHQDMIIVGSVEFKSLFFKFLRSPLLLTVLIYISGFSAVAQPVELGAVFLRGIAVGLSVAYYYAFFGFRGFLISLFLVVPFALSTSAVIILASREAFGLSASVGAFLTGSAKVNYCCNIRIYSIKFLILVLALTAICAVQCLLTGLLQGIL